MIPVAERMHRRLRSPPHGLYRFPLRASGILSRTHPPARLIEARLGP